jgi:hypothetical protein
MSYRGECQCLYTLSSLDTSDWHRTEDVPVRTCCKMVVLHTSNLCHQMSARDRS